MKNKSIFTALTIIMSAILPGLSTAQAGSIQIIEPSTSKFEVIGTKKKIAPKPAAKSGVKKQEKPAEPEMPVKPVAAKPIMPQMRTGEAELPIVPVSETKSKQSE